MSMTIARWLTVASFIFYNFAYANSPLGYWKTIDDVSGQPKSILEVYSDKDNRLFGKVVKVFPRPGYSKNLVCKACKGDKHDQPILGLVVMENLKKALDDDRWAEGSITDPLSGKVYKCSLQLLRDGKLLVRGYIGLPLFGRSQQWERVDTVNG